MKRDEVMTEQAANQKEPFSACLPTAFFENDGATCIIVGAGDCGDLRRMPHTIREKDLVIAADGGYIHLQRAGLRCDLLMGDLDSLPAKTEITSETRYFSPIKDDTDTMLAVKHGLEQGYRRFLLFGVFGGGRLDHTIATVQTILYLCDKGAEVYAFGSGAYMTAVQNGALTFSDRARGYVSLFALGGEARGVDLEALKYPLSDAVLYPDIALGVSNEFLPGRAARVCVKDGLLLLVKPFEKGEMPL